MVGLKPKEVCGALVQEVAKALEMQPLARAALYAQAQRSGGKELGAFQNNTSFHAYLCSQ